MRDTAGEVRTTLKATFFHGAHHTGVQMLDDQLEAYLQHLCTDTGYYVEELLETMDDGNEWRERERVSETVLATHDEDYIYIYIYMENQLISILKKC